MEKVVLFLHVVCAASFSICHAVYGANEAVTGYNICKGGKISGNVSMSFEESNELECGRRCLEEATCKSANFIESNRSCLLFVTVPDEECQSLQQDTDAEAIIKRGSPACSGKGLLSRARKCICNRQFRGDQCEKEVKIHPNGYEGSENISSSYRISNIDATWYDANDTCVAEGGHILRIESSEELTAYASAVFQPKYDVSGTMVWFLDGTAEGLHDIWQTGQHDNVSWLEWGGTEPTGDDPPCLGVHQLFGWKFVDLRCSSPFSFICEID